MTSQPTNSARGRCPVCAMPVPFKRANIKPGRYICKGCGHSLQTSKSSIGTAMAAFAAASLLGKAFGFLAGVGVLMALAIYQWLTIRVSLSEDDLAAPQ